MDIDFGALWSWTVPLWGLFVIVFALGGIMMQPAVLEALDNVATPAATGGYRGKKGRS